MKKIGGFMKKIVNEIDIDNKRVMDYSWRFRVARFAIRWTETIA